LTEFQRYVPSDNEGDAASRAEARAEAWADRRESIGRLVGEFRQAMRINRLPLVCGTAGLLVGVLAVVLVVSQMRAAGASSGWPVTTGRLVSVDLHKRTGFIRAGRIGTWIDNPTWGLTVVYHYRVDGVAYQGTRFSFEPDGTDQDYWAAKARRYREMVEVPVHYDPADPAEAVLETGLHPSTWLFLCMGIVLACGGVFLLIKEWRFRLG
jgi:hypothetical protein